MATRETKIPSIPAVPDGLSEDMTDFLSAIKERLEIREGRANALDRTLVRADLLKIGIDVRSLDKDSPSYPFRDLVTGEWKIGTKLLEVTDPTSAQDATTKNYVESGNFNARIKGWIQFTMAGAGAIADSFNVTSITDIAVGHWTITWATDFANDDYAAAGMTVTGTIIAVVAASITAGTLSVISHQHDGTPSDPSIVNVIAIGDQ